MLIYFRRLFILLFSIAHFSCNNSGEFNNSGDLTKEQAEKIIRAGHPYPFYSKEWVSLTGSVPAEASYFRQLHAAGVISNYEWMEGHWEAALSELGKKYVVDSRNQQVLVIEARVNFGKIDSVKMRGQNDTAQVSYTCTVDSITPFGQVLGDVFVYNRINKGERIKVDLVRRDSGWVYTTIRPLK